MKIEAYIFLALTAFAAVIAPVYWILSRDATGTTALILTFFLCLMIAGYLGLIARRLDPRPEDKRTGEIAEGAGELGFFPPQSKWPLFVALTAVLVFLGPVFGWWLTILGFGFGAISLTGLLYEFYRGDHAH
ncbi:cytochrome c oxidase subunit 4 [Microlunatus capsulatus]|uniref:Cytochrome c oxidase polypeptide 4 n=1 Tax=Microlunatus capsulatus TaxID=99117 RepID=A0ABS4ZC68_9ACTN|nr:cytochrome c oxidase subunit 4 [Microlunatus capsulatus]MBP2418310.1 membrane protein implicated in regulation of membrane protease activity [Microlunatus capsulatus]